MKLATKLIWLAGSAFSMSAIASDKHATHWEYEGKAGAQHWAEIDKGFSACKLSREQSPINIQTARAKREALPPIDFTYAGGAAEVVNNGHTVQVNLPPGSMISLGKDEYKLLQFHFHTPSEEKINGKNYPMVAHFVHQSGTGKLAVVAVLLNEGKENAALKPVFASLPAKQGDKAQIAAFNPAEALPAGHGYYAFTGSLTTPPCSDGVRWQVLRDPVDISHEQLHAFQALYKMNARPVQPLNGRVVKVSK
jgi:carbonic anhydrase